MPENPKLSSPEINAMLPNQSHVEPDEPFSA